MKDKFNWVYFVLALVAFAFGFVFIYKHEFSYSAGCFLITQVCLFHIKLNEIAWMLEHDYDEDEKETK